MLRENCPWTRGNRAFLPNSASRRDEWHAQLPLVGRSHQLEGGRGYRFRIKDMLRQLSLIPKSGYAFFGGIKIMRRQWSMIPTKWVPVSDKIMRRQQWSAPQ